MPADPRALSSSCSFTHNQLYDVSITSTYYTVRVQGLWATDQYLVGLFPIHSQCGLQWWNNQFHFNNGQISSYQNDPPEDNNNKFWLLLLFSHPVMSDSATPWTAAHRASLSLTISWSLSKFMSIASVMPSSHLILWSPLLLPSTFPSIKDFSKESAVCIRWPKYWSSG